MDQAERAAAMTWLVAALLVSASDTMAVAKELADPESAARWLAELELGGEQAHVVKFREWLHTRVRSSSWGARYLDLALPEVDADEVAELCRLFLKRIDSRRDTRSSGCADAPTARVAARSRI